MDAIRIESAQALAEAYNDISKAVILEAYAWTSSCSSGHMEGIPAWSYSNGVTLFETDRPEAHARELLASYLDQIERCKCAIKYASIGRGLRPEDLELPEHEVAAGSPYAQWNEAYLTEVTRSKQVLEEEEDASLGSFIKCVKCKSDSVHTEQKQTRSADEPMTLFCLCRKCGARFVMH